MIWIASILLVGSFATAAMLTRVVCGVARRAGLLDVPGGHKQHVQPTPLGGGLAIMATIGLFLLGSAAMVAIAGRQLVEWLPADLAVHLPGLTRKMPQALVLLAGAGLMCLMGLVDDAWPMRPGVKLAVQFAVAVGTVLLLPVRAGEFLPSAASAALTVLWIVTIANAINFIDNMDGLAAGVVVICGGVFAAAAAVNGQLFVPAMLLVIVGAGAGFLVHNFPPAKVFMGDAGSQPLGYLLGVLTVLTTYTRQFADQPAAVLVPPIVLAIPLYDLASVCVVRALERRSLLSGDRSHFSHRLVRCGMTVRGAVLTVYLATFTTALAAVFLLKIPLHFAPVVVLQTVCVLGIIALLEFSGRIRRRR